MKVLSLAIFACLLGLGTAGQPGFTEDEIADIYIAALNGEVRQDPPRDAALNPYLMTDAGHYTPSGRIPERVVERLRAQGLFSELCGEGRIGGAGPRCISQHARGELRLSRAIPRGVDAADVYIGGGSLRPEGDTTSVYIHVGGTMRCRIVREGGRWIRRACENTMMV